MPFDAISPQDSDSNSAIALYRQRRENAIVLWQQVPPTKFDMRTWQREDNTYSRGGHISRTTRACAIGWLAVMRHDGWTFGVFGAVPVYHDLWGYFAAKSYFGLSFKDTYRCFAAKPTGSMTEPFIPCVTPTDVAAALLASSYVAGQPPSGLYRDVRFPPAFSGRPEPELERSRVVRAFSRRPAPESDSSRLIRSLIGPIRVAPRTQPAAI